jgi:hypothetical protein
MYRTDYGRWMHKQVVVGARRQGKAKQTKRHIVVWGAVIQWMCRQDGKCWLVMVANRTDRWGRQRHRA